MLLQYCKSDGHANKAISTTLGTQRLVTQQFLTQEFTELTLYSRVHVTKVTWTRGNTIKLKHFSTVVTNSCISPLSLTQFAQELWTIIRDRFFSSRISLALEIINKITH